MHPAFPILFVQHCFQELFYLINWLKVSTSNLQFIFYIAFVCTRHIILEPLLQKWVFMCHKIQCLPRNGHLDDENQQN